MVGYTLLLSSSSSIMNLTDKESVGSNSSTTLPPSASFTTHPQSLAIAGTMASPRKNNDKCFRCQEIGHWAQNYPNQTPNTRSSPPKSPADHGVPPLHCPCQAVQCVILIAGPNSQYPGWKYYRCPASGARRCRICLWCKYVTMEGIIKHPISGCEAGECRIVEKFFVCPIKRVLEGVIKYRWNSLPVTQRDGMKNYISDVIVKVLDAPVVTPLMDFIRQRRAAKSGIRVYNNELGNKVSRLEEENERRRRKKLKPSSPVAVKQEKITAK